MNEYRIREKVPRGNHYVNSRKKEEWYLWNFKRLKKKLTKTLIKTLFIVQKSKIHFAPAICEILSNACYNFEIYFVSKIIFICYNLSV